MRKPLVGLILLANVSLSHANRNYSDSMYDGPRGGGSFLGTLLLIAIGALFIWSFFTDKQTRRNTYGVLIILALCSGAVWLTMTHIQTDDLAVEILLLCGAIFVGFKLAYPMAERFWQDESSRKSSNAPHRTGAAVISEPSNHRSISATPKNEETLSKQDAALLKSSIRKAMLHLGKASKLLKCESASETSACLVLLETQDSLNDILMDSWPLSRDPERAAFLIASRMAKFDPFDEYHVWASFYNAHEVIQRWQTPNVDPPTLIALDFPKLRNRNDCVSSEVSLKNTTNQAS